MSAKVTVKTLDGRDVPFELGAEDKIEDLKKAIEREMSIAISRQRIIFHGRVLNDEETVAELGLDGRVVHLVERQSRPPRPPPSATSDLTRQMQIHPPVIGHEDRNRVYAGSVVLSMPPLSLEEVQNAVRHVLQRYGEIGQGINFTAAEHSDPRRYELSVTLDGHLMTIDSPAYERVVYLQDTLGHLRYLLQIVEEEAMLDVHIEEAVDSEQQCESATTDRCDTKVQGLPDNQVAKPGSRAKWPQYPPLESSTSESRIHRIGPYRTRNALRSDLINIMRQVTDLHQRMQATIELMTNCLAPQESALGDSATLYIDHVQRLLHLYSHALHVLGDLYVVNIGDNLNLLRPLVIEREHAVRWANISIILGDRRPPFRMPGDVTQMPTQSGSGGSNQGQPPTVAMRATPVRNMGIIGEGSVEQRPNAGTDAPNASAPRSSSVHGRSRAIHSFIETIMSAVVGRRTPNVPEEGAATAGATGDSRANESQRRRRSGAEHISRHFNFVVPNVAAAPVSETRGGLRPSSALAAFGNEMLSDLFGAGRIGREDNFSDFDTGRSRVPGSEPFLECSSRHCSATMPYGRAGRPNELAPPSRLSSRVGSAQRTAAESLEASLDHIFRMIIETMANNMQDISADFPAGASMRSDGPAFYSLSFNATLQERPAVLRSGDSSGPAMQPGPNDVGDPFSVDSMARLPTPLGSGQSLVNMLRCILFMNILGEEDSRLARGVFSTIVFALGPNGLAELSERNFDALNQRRESIRHYLIDHVFNGTDTPTCSQFQQAARMLRSDLACVREAVLLEPDFTDFTAIERFNRQELMYTERILRFCLTHPSNEGFGKGLYKILTLAVYEVAKAIVLIDSTDESLSSMTREEIDERIHTFFRNYGRDPVAMVASRLRRFTTTFLDEYAAVSELHENTSHQDGKSNDAEMSAAGEDEQAASAVARSPSNFMDLGAPQNRPPHVSIPKRSVNPAAPPIIDHPGSVDDAASMMFHIHDELPPPLISVVEEDIVRQRGMPPQPPFTETYINGMPAKRRRVMEENRPHLADNAGDLLREALRRSMSDLYEGMITSAQGDAIAAAVTNDVLTGGLHELLQERIQRRLRFDRDFDRVRFPFSDKYFKP